MPAGDAPFGIVFKHGAIDNVIGGVLGSGEYQAHNAANAVRRDSGGYVNYFWGNDLRTGPNTYRPGNVVAFVLSRQGQRHSAIVNGKLNASRTHVVGRFSSPFHATIGKTYGDNEYLNGTLHFLYILNEAMPREMLLATGVWRESGI
jgi:hypothetical protein